MRLASGGAQARFLGRSGHTGRRASWNRGEKSSEMLKVCRRKGPWYSATSLGMLGTDKVDAHVVGWKTDSINARGVGVAA